MATATFFLNWKVDRTVFEQTEGDITKVFLMSNQNVVLQWKVIMEFESSTVGIWISYNDGPLPKVNTTWQASMIRTDQATIVNCTWDAVEDYPRDGGRGLPDFADRDLQTAYGLSATEPIIFRVELKLPVAAFQYQLEFPFVDPSPPWLIEKFENIESPRQDSDAQFVSSDDVVFYCHKFVIASQSEAFEAMFCSRQTEDERNGIYRLPTLGKEALKAVLRYLYTGLTESGDLPVVDIVEVAHVAEQYGLGKLKQSCEAAFWKRVGETAGSEECMKVILYAEGKNKYLKQRAMDALVEKLGSQSFTTLLYQHCTHGDYSDAIIDKFTAFCSARVTSIPSQ